MPGPVWIVLAGTFINRFGSFVMPFLTIYLSRQGYGIAQTGLAVSAYGAGHLMASMLGGYLADRIGRRYTIALSMFTSAATMIALSQARSFTAIVIITILAGAASELYRPAAAALIGDFVPPERRITAFALYRFAVNLGFAAGPATAGFLANHDFLWLFVGDAITSVGYGIIALLLLPHGFRSSAQEEAGEGAVRHALRNPAFLIFLAATVCSMTVEFQLHSTFPLYMTSLGYSPAAYGLLLSFNGLLIVLFELAITAWTQRFDPRKMIAIGYALSTFGVASIGLAHSMPALALTVVIWTAGEMIYAPVTGAYVTNLAPPRYRGRYHGMWVLMWSVGMLGGPSIGTWLFSRNPDALWIACAVMGVIATTLPLIRTTKMPQLHSQR
jgi:MFS family permease